MSGAAKPDIGKCNVCNINDAIGVASSPFEAISFAYCQPCLQKPADCEMMFHYLYCDVADGDPSQLHAGINYYFTFREGAYISWPDWVRDVGSKIDMDAYRREQAEGIAKANAEAEARILRWGRRPRGLLMDGDFWRGFLIAGVICLALYVWIWWAFW